MAKPVTRPDQSPIFQSAYFKARMTVTYRSLRTGRAHTRTVDIGHVRGDEDFDGMACLNVGIYGTVISHAIECVSAERAVA